MKRTNLYTPICYTLMCTLLAIGSVALAQESESNSFGDSIFDKVKNLYQGDSNDEADATPPLRNPFEPQLPIEPETDTQQFAIPSLPEPITPEVTPTPRPTPIPPQMPTTTQAPTIESNLEISGIIWNTDRPQAIINNQVVEIGDIVSGAVIDGISQNEVLVRIGDQQVKIPYRSVSLSINNNNTKSSASKQRRVERHKNTRTNKYKGSSR